MDILEKLQLKPGATLAVVGAPADSPLPAHDPGEPGTADAVVLFLRLRDELEQAGSVLDAGRADRLAWIAYPKAGRLGTDLNRDSLAAAVSELGLRPVRQVALDDTWSALRFRPAL